MLLRCLLLCLALLPLGAQERRPMPGLTLRHGDRSEPARIHDLAITVTVVGHVATTTWDLTVFNPQDRVLEGELVFPLGEGQTVSRFALDVNGRLREGVVVEKAKGRIAFEETVRRGIDPGLLEKTAGNSFRARVYPIPARGYKRVVLAYEQELQDADGDHLRYRLPLAFTDRVATFRLRMEVLDQPESPTITAKPSATFAFKQARRAWIAEETLRDVAPDAPLEVVIPRSEGSAQAFVERRNGETYAFVMVHPRAIREAKVLPKRLLVLWDASASARSRDRKREIQLLEGYLRRLGPCTLRLAVFRNTAEPLKTFAMPQDAAALRAHLEALPLDGATRLEALDLASEPADETLLFSDGLATLGGGEPRLPAAPLLALSSAQAADHGRLRALSEGRGGELLNLQRLSDAEAAQALTTRPLAFLRATYPEGSLSEVHPSQGQAVRGPFGLAARLIAERTKVTLHFGFGTTVRFTQVIDLDAAQAAVEAPVARLWAQKKLAALELDRARNAQAITALGQAHGLVTEGTSLIVLDDVADYVRHRIVPPEDLRAEYDRRVAEEKDRKTRDAQDHLEALVTAFTERKQWWDTVFKAPKGKFREAKELRAPGVAGAGVAGNISLVEDAPPPPPPPPVPMDLAVEARVQLDRPITTQPSDRPQDPFGPGPAATITLKPWDPETPYLKELKAAPKAERYGRYLALREAHGGTPGFYLDVSDFFRGAGEEELALRILTNLAELKLEDAALLRVLGHRLRQLGHHRLAVQAFEEVLRLREEEPQSRRDVALACQAEGQLQRALDLLWEVATT
ncbi:MAG TPA: VIT domain-containing protein, partial [Holophaga sp.]|nr:VIT domain-containing protein [Holophaga sp.]